MAAPVGHLHHSLCSSAPMPASQINRYRRCLFPKPQFKNVSGFLFPGFSSSLAIQDLSTLEGCQLGQSRPHNTLFTTHTHTNTHTLAEACYILLMTKLPHRASFN